MKQNIEYIAPYCSFDLNTIYNLSDVISLREGIKDEVREKKLTHANLDFVCQFCKPILRPLSDLNKEIIINGEKHQMWLLINGQKAFNNGKIENMNGYQYDILELSYRKLQTILKFHFDVFGLIEKSLAVDINTLSVE